jgi:hypothetical protein
MDGHGRPAGDQVGLPPLLAQRFFGETSSQNISTSASPSDVSTRVARFYLDIMNPITERGRFICHTDPSPNIQIATRLTKCGFLGVISLRWFFFGESRLHPSAGKFDQACPNIRLFRRLSDRRNMSDEKKATPTPSEAESTA